MNSLQGEMFSVEWCTFNLAMQTLRQMAEWWNTILNGWINGCFLFEICTCVICHNIILFRCLSSINQGFTLDGVTFLWPWNDEILSYCSPSGCTFWGKKPWSKKKKILWQLGTLIGAPIAIALIAGISVPLFVIGLPIVVGRKVCT